MRDRDRRLVAIASSRCRLPASSFTLRRWLHQLSTLRSSSSPSAHAAIASCVARIISHPLGALTHA
jgi:hypothetical protein